MRKLFLIASPFGLKNSLGVGGLGTVGACRFVWGDCTMLDGVPFGAGMFVDGEDTGGH